MLLIRLAPAPALLLALLVSAPPRAEEALYRIAAAEQPFLHDWRATFSVGAAQGPLYDNADRRTGHSRSEQAVGGLEAGIGARGFGRLELGRSWSDGRRAFADDDMRSDSDADILGASGGIFLLPFLSTGLSLQRRNEDGREIFINRAGGFQNDTERDGHSTRIAPFLLLAGPVGPVELGLLTAYARTRTETDYRRPQLTTPESHDNGQVNARFVDASVGYWLFDDLRLGGSIGWTEVVRQRVQGTGLALDRDWGTLGLNLTYRLTERIEAGLRGDRDIENARGNATRFGASLAYRF